MCAWLSPKTGINCGNSNTPLHYLDITVPSTDTVNSINIANTYNGTSVMYVDSNGNVSMSDSLTSAGVNITSTGIVLPVTYTPSLPGTGYMGNIITVTGSVAAVTSAVFKNLTSISLAAGVWILQGSVTYNTTSGSTNSNVYFISSNISTSATSNDSNAAICKISSMNFNFTNANLLTKNTVNVTRFVSITSSTTYYLNAYAYFPTGSLQVSANKLYAVRIQ